ncbi:MAG: thioredoxin, partial [Candidatus Bathyarchaeia archaeon]
ERALNENPILIVDCWAPWCGPCRALAPLIDDLARTYHGKVAFGKVNVDDNPRIAQMYGVMSIPTLLFIKNGQLVDRLVGVVPKKTIEDKIRKML